jgi:hypothetical protein
MGCCGVLARFAEWWREWKGRAARDDLEPCGSDLKTIARVEQHADRIGRTDCEQLQFLTVVRFCKVKTGLGPSQTVRSRYRSPRANPAPSLRSMREQGRHLPAG